MIKLIGTLILLFHCSLVIGQVSLNKIALKNGLYNVGFRHHIAYDSTRTYKRIFDWNNQTMPRPVPVSVWYPANKQTKSLPRMTVLNYMEILKQEEEWEYLPNEQILNWFYYPNTPDNKKHLEEITTATTNIKTADGSFPVVIYAPSYQASSIENFALCEYLASHGYIVVSSPSRGTENRFLEGGTLKDMETQARDIEFLLQETSKIAQADHDKVATMGFSFGGLSNVLAQMRNEKIKANVSLDGSIKYQYATLKKSPFADIDKADVPFIHMAQKNIPENVLQEDKLDAGLNSKFEFFDSLTHSDAYSLQLHDLTHYAFSTLGILFQPRDIRQDKPDSAIMKSYKLVARYTLNFLNAYLRNDTMALGFLNRDPEENGIDKNLLSKKHKNPKVRPFSFQDFNELAQKQAYTNLDRLYDSLRLKHSALALAEGNLNNLGLQLVFNPRTSAQGINVLQLAVTIYPKSANLFDSLAEAYLFINDKGKAAQHFAKSLELDATNQNARNRLKELKKKSSH